MQALLGVRRRRAAHRRALGRPSHRQHLDCHGLGAVSQRLIHLQPRAGHPNTRPGAARPEPAPNRRAQALSERAASTYSCCSCCTTRALHVAQLLGRSRDASRGSCIQHTLPKPPLPSSHSLPSGRWQISISAGTACSSVPVLSVLGANCTRVAEVGNLARASPRHSTPPRPIPTHRWG